MELPYQQKEDLEDVPIGESFNPCFNGIAISTRTVKKDTSPANGFNPCFNGIAISTLIC